MTPWWQYDQLPSGEPYDWSPAARGDSPYDNIDFHLDLGCGRLKKGRLGVDRFPAPGVDLAIDLESMSAVVAPAPDNRVHAIVAARKLYSVAEETMPLFVGLPFPDSSIESIISHHFMEHLGDGFIPLMDECHRILKPGGILRIIVPLFPSRTAVEDPDHKRWFMEGTFETFCGNADGTHWHESFSVPYTSCRFEKVDQDITAPAAPGDEWGPDDAREMRVALRKREMGS